MSFSGCEMHKDIIEVVTKIQYNQDITGKYRRKGENGDKDCDM